MGVIDRVEAMLHARTVEGDASCICRKNEVEKYRVLFEMEGMPCHGTREGLCARREGDEDVV